MERKQCFRPETIEKRLGLTSGGGGGGGGGGSAGLRPGGQGGRGELEVGSRRHTFDSWKHRQNACHHILGIGTRDPPWTYTMLSTLHFLKIRSKRRRRLLQLVLLVSPSLRIGPAPFAHSSRHVRPGRGQSASCRRRSVAASASPPLPASYHQFVQSPVGG